MMKLSWAIAFLILCWGKYILTLKDNCTVNKLKIPTDPTNIRTIYQYSCSNIKYFYPFFLKYLINYFIIKNRLKLPLKYSYLSKVYF